MADIQWDDSKAVSLQTPPASIQWDDSKAQDIGPSAGGAFADHAANGAMFGFGDEAVGAYKALAKRLLPAALGGTDKTLLEQYREDRDATRQRLAADQAAHPVASVAGDLVGTAAPALLLPGSTMASAGRAAVTAGVQGGVAGLGNSTADLTRGDVAGAAKDAATGVGLGVVAGAAGQKLASAIPRAAGAAKDFLQDLAERKAVNALRPTAGEVRGLIEQGRLGDLGQWLLRNKVVEAGDTFSDIATKAQGVKGGAGAALDTSLQALDATGQTIDKVKLAQAFQDLAQDAKAQGPAAQHLVDKYLGAADSVMNDPADKLTFSQLEAWKRGYQGNVNYGKLNPSAAQQGDAEIASATRALAEQEAGQAAPGTVSDQFLNAKRAYGNAKAASDMAEGALARQEARNIASPSDKLTAGGAALAGVMTGHPVAGVVGGLAVGAANKLIRDRGASTIAAGAKSASEKLAQLALTNPQALGRYGSVLAGALQRGGQQEFAASSYALSQTDPEFQALQQKLMEK